MRTFILRSILFITTFICFGQVVKSLLPYYWGNAWLVHKHANGHDDIVEANYIFIGSSRTYRHIIPTVFDSILTLNGIPGRSYNLGSPAVFPPQSYFLLEKAIEEGDISNGCTVFLELSETREIPSDQLGSARASYWSNIHDLLYVLDYGIRCAPDSIKQRLIKSHSSVYFQNLFSIAQYRGMMDRTDVLDITEDKLNSKGFVSLDRELEFSNNNSIKEHLNARHYELQNDSSILNDQMNLNTKIRTSSHNNNCDMDLERLIQLHNKCRANGVRLIILMPAAFMTHGLYSLYQRLPNNMKMDLSDPATYPQWYEYEFRFDKGHLNEAGALKYTQCLALQYVSFSKLYNGY